MSGVSFLAALQEVVDRRMESGAGQSYTAKLARQGVRRAAQKLGEEGVELALAAVDEESDRVTAEAADLLYHLIVVLRLRDVKIEDVVAELERRHAASARTGEADKGL